MRPLFLVLASALLAPAAASQTRPAFTDLVVFGDSLSDNGNHFAQTGQPAAPYWRGRSSNGPVWVEQMANHLGLRALEIDDRAVAFATTQDALLLQVLPHVSSPAGVDPGALHVWWAGANDLFGLLGAPGGDPAVVLGAAMQNTADALLSLLGSGAQHVLVVNLPDLSATPLVVELGDPQLAATVQALTRAYNTALSSTIAALEAATGAEILEVDAYALTRALVSAPRTGGFLVVDARALDPVAGVTGDPDRFLFWDHVHPTTRGHSLVMGAALAQLGLVLGDVNGDGSVDDADAVALQAALGPCPAGTPADLDGNGRVDLEDRELLRILLQA